jgi:uncharacterized membrane protein affecting hemolysin expression
MLTEKDNDKRSKNKPKIALISLLSVAVLSSSAAIWQNQRGNNKLLQPLGDVVAQQISTSTAPHLLNNDRISIQALASASTENRSVLHTAIYNVRNQLVAQSGRASEVDAGMQVSAAITMQDQLLGYTRVTLAASTRPAWRSQWLLLLSVLSGLSALYFSLQLSKSDDEPADDEEKPAAAANDEPSNNIYAQSFDARGPCAVIAVELLQLTLMRKQLTEDTLYDYLTTFEYWLQQVARLFSAQIQISETGFTLFMNEDSLSDADDHITTRALQCAYAINTVLSEANKHRMQNSEPAFEARLGVHTNIAKNTETKLLRDLFVHDAQRQAWQVCQSKPNSSVSVSQSVVDMHEHREIELSERSDHASAELRSVSVPMERSIRHQLARILESHQDQAQDSIAR